MLLDQAVQRRLLRTVTLVVDQVAIRRPLGLPADGLHARLPSLRRRTASSSAPRRSRLPGLTRIPAVCWRQFRLQLRVRSPVRRQQADCRHRRLMAGTSSSRTGQEADIDRQNHLAGVIKVCMPIGRRRELGRPASVLLAIDRTAALGIRFQFAPRFPRRHPPRYQGSAQWIQVWNGPGVAARRGGSSSAGRSALPSFSASNACRSLPDQVQAPRPLSLIHI